MSPRAHHAAVALTPPQPVSAVTAQTWEPDAPGPVVVLAHGAGSRLAHPVHQGVCAAIASHGHPVVSFNFPYVEAGRRAPDPEARLLRCWTDVVAWTREHLAARPLVLGGRSMGGRYASMLVADGAECAGLVLLNYPLLPSNRRPDTQPRADHWPRIRVPVLLVHGDRDRLFDADVFAAHRHLLPGDVTVHVVTGADHGFAVPKRTGRTPAQVHAEVGQAVSAWLSAAVVVA